MRRNATFSSKAPLAAPRSDRSTSRLRAVPSQPASLIWDARIPRTVARSMLGSLSHDVRSPLMALSMNLHSIEELVHRGGTAPAAELAELFEDAREACAAIADKIELVRAQTNDTPTSESFDVGEVAATTARFFRWHAQQRGVRLSVEIERGLHGYGHVGEIGWTLLHALVRVSDAMSSGETVHVRASKRDAGIRIQACGAEDIDVLVDERGAVTTRLTAPRR